MNIGPAIKTIRKNLNIAQNELARKSGITQTSLSLIETGAQRPGEKAMKKICSALGVPEAVIYIIAIQEVDIPQSKSGIYQLVYPSILSLALQMVNTEHFVNKA